MMAKAGSAAPQQQAESLPPPPLPPGVTAPVQTGTQPPPSTRPPIAAPGSWPRAQQTPQASQASQSSAASAGPQPNIGQSAPAPPPMTRPQPTLNTSGKTAAPPPKMGQSSMPPQPSGPSAPTLNTSSAPAPPPPQSTVPTGAGSTTPAASSPWPGIVALIVIIMVVIGILWATGVIGKPQPAPRNVQPGIQQPIPRGNSPGTVIEESAVLSVNKNGWSLNDHPFLFTEES
ncbi:MAG TPA: hypothetical protein VJ183_08170 [Chloroflexia bacterium]|nr:hypothetical protein [Chloroflexia bacterium]